MKILFIITGSVAVSRCYEILEKLKKLKVDVDCVLTTNAKKLVIISKLRNNIPIQIKNKNLKFTSSKPSKLKISSNKYKKEFKNKVNTSFKNGIDRLIKWNLNKNEK